MPIQVSCDCGKTLRLNDDRAGKKVQCPGCRNMLAVPAAVAPMKKRRLWPYLLFGCLGLTGLGCAGVVGSCATGVGVYGISQTGLGLVDSILIVRIQLQVCFQVLALFHIILVDAPGFAGVQMVEWFLWI